MTVVSFWHKIQQEEAALSRRNNIERLVNLTLFLISRKNNFVSLREIAEKVSGYDPDASEDAIRQMFHRDKRDLEKSGIIIEYNSYFDGYRLSRAIGTLSDLKLTDEEKLAMLYFFRALNTMKAFPFYEDLRSAVVKLALNFGLGGQITGLYPALGIFFDYDDEVLDNFDFAHQAIEKQQMLEFSYRPHYSESFKRYRVAPVMLVFRNADWYLAALHDGDIRFFKLDRMKDPVLAGRVEQQHGWSREEIRERISKSPWQYEEGPEEEILIRISGETAGVFLNTFSGAELIESMDNHAVLKLKISSRKRFVQRFMPFVFDAEILEPDEVKEMVVEKIKELARSCS